MLFSSFQTFHLNKHVKYLTTRGRVCVKSTGQGYKVPELSLATHSHESIYEALEAFPVLCALCSLSTLQNTHLIDNFPTLNDIETLRQGSVFAGSDVGHLIHYHRAEGVFFDQGPGRSQSLLQVFVHADVDVVCKGPSIYKKRDGFIYLYNIYHLVLFTLSTLKCILGIVYINQYCYYCIRTTVNDLKYYCHYQLHGLLQGKQRGNLPHH